MPSGSKSCSPGWSTDEDSPWYPTMRLIRQRAPREWDGRLAVVAASTEG
ncbi:hypothetical protein ACVWZZ_008178 [Bradyrhizobium sp. LM6.10]